MDSTSINNPASSMLQPTVSILPDSATPKTSTATTSALVQHAADTTNQLFPKIQISSQASSSSPTISLGTTHVNTPQNTPQNSEQASWVKSALRVAVVALPIIGLITFIGVSIGVGVATGGVGLAVPLLAGLFLAATIYTSGGISYFNENLWDDDIPLNQSTPSSNTNSSSSSSSTLKVEKDDEEEDKRSSGLTSKKTNRSKFQGKKVSDPNEQEMIESQSKSKSFKMPSISRKKKNDDLDLYKII